MLYNPTVDQMFRLAAEHDHAGRTAWACDLYRQILSAVPNHAPSLQALEKCASHCRMPAPKELSAAKRFPSFGRHATA